LREFLIITSNFDAEFGRYPGAVVNTVTRSGTNTYHGGACDYLRNCVFNGRNYFTQLGTNAPEYIQNYFGGGVGGPLTVPHVIKGRDKLFFFVSYQGMRFHTQTTINPTALVVPTDAERSGDFSASDTKPSATFCPPHRPHFLQLCLQFRTPVQTIGMAVGSVERPYRQTRFCHVECEP
jgi:hypothetical protein